MKKNLIILFSFIIFTSNVFAKKWTNNIGAGATIPFSIIGLDSKGADDINQVGYGIEGTYIGLHENGFTAKANVSVGAATSKDVAIQDRNTNIGVFENIALGAGYSFVNTEKFLFGTTAMLGIELGQYSSKEKDVYIDEEISGKSETAGDVTTSLSLVTVSLGADIFGICRLNKRLGFFANLNARWILGGTTSSEVKNEWDDGHKTKTLTDSSENDLIGKFIVQPTIGVIWTF